MSVGTRGAVRGLSPAELKKIGAGVVLGNTYHLYMCPGLEIVREAGGLHKFSGWDGPMLTDFGGYQVLSLSRIRHLTEEGVEFTSVYDGFPHTFTPEVVVEAQEALGADVAMVLDECPPAEADYEY
jgi:queuine tRNA-ribosyltransferase